MFYPVKHGSVNHWTTEKIIEDVKQYTDEEYVVSEIVERPVLSKRYVELNMLARSTTILYDDQKQSTDKII